MTADTPAAATRNMNNIEKPSGMNTQDLPPQSIGNILVSAGRLTSEAAEQIHRKQGENNILFGETGISLGLISREDLEYAIARQFEYSVLKKGDSAISEEMVSAYDPFGGKAEAFRELRTHLLLRWIETESKPKTLSILSTQRGEGRSYVASNLAVSFSQLGLKTLLVDADLRHSHQHHYFGISCRRGLSSILQGKGDPGFIVQIPEIRNLSVLPAGPHAPNPQELLSQARFPDLMNELATHFDLVVVDTPAALLYSDAVAIATRTSASIAVARQGYSKVEQLRQLKENMSRTGDNLLGSVLLDF